MGRSGAAHRLGGVTRAPFPDRGPRATEPSVAGDGQQQQGAGNRLLAALPRGEAELLRPWLQPFCLVSGAALLEPGQPIERVVFPDSGVVRLSTGPGGPGGRAEVSLVGREGLLGLYALLGGRTAPVSAIVQIGGQARHAPVRALRPLINGRSFAFRDLVLRCAGAHLAEAATTAACNALHPLRQRAARWLLAFHDRVGPGFSLTQASLAEMLGARRPTMNAVLQQLKADGLIRTARGRIAVADAAALEGAACACRQVMLAARKDLAAGF